MLRILANDGIHEEGKRQLEAAGFEVVTAKVAQEDLAAALHEFDAITVRSATKLRKADIDACGSRLKLAVRAGVGLDNIDVEYAESKGIKVTNTPRSSSQSVAELAMGHFFSLARHLHTSNRDMATRGATDFKKLKDQFSEGAYLLRGKTLGIAGFGRIGQELARLALGMGMKVIPVDIVEKDVVLTLDINGAEVPVTLRTTSLANMLPQADLISMHLPWSGGRPIIGAEEFAVMKKGVALVNTARGGAIGELELLAALESGQVSAVALDVFENEPTPRPELLNHPKISVTPHTGASTNEAQAAIAAEIVDIMKTFFGKN